MNRSSYSETKYKTTLPSVNSNGYYEIRLESIGGLGANMCGKLLGELGAGCLGLNASAFSSYGSEKRGSPVKSYVRWSPIEKEILHNSPVETPDLLVLFHHALSKSIPVTAGVKEYSTVLVNTSISPEELRSNLSLCAKNVYCINALDIAIKTKSRINMIILGAIVKALGFVPLDAAKELISETLGKKYPAMLEKNLIGLEAGYTNVSISQFSSDERYKEIPYTEVKNKWGYSNAPIGGENPHFGSTVSNDLSASREGFIPIFLPDKCIHCGLCDSTCPDMVFQFKHGEYKNKPSMINSGLDYMHCKGCLRCVDVCPTEALVVGKESEHPSIKWNVNNKDLITNSINYDTAGADAYVTGESYLDEKRVDGGLM